MANLSSSPSQPFSSSIFTQRLSTFTELEQQNSANVLTLSLSAEERTRSRHRFETANGQALFLRLPRGTVLRDGDFLQAENGAILKIIAQPEPVLTVTASTPLKLLQAAYHLGNRHVPLEISSTYLRLSPDLVLEGMLKNLEVKVKAETLPFHPEIGAYKHKH